MLRCVIIKLMFTLFLLSFKILLFILIQFNFEKINKFRINSLYILKDYDINFFHLKLIGYV